MSNEIINRKQKETGISKAKLEKLWKQAMGMASEKNLKGEAFFKMLNSIFETLVKNSVKKEEIDCDVADVICEWLDYLDEETASGDVAQGDSMLNSGDSMFMRKPCFHLGEREFMKIGFCNRKKRQWRNRFYGSKVGDWSRQNKNKDFYIKNTDNDMYLHIDRDRYKSERNLK